MKHRARLLVFALLAPLTLTGGFRCYYSDDSDSDFDRLLFGNNGELTVVVAARKQQQTPIEGLDVIFSDRSSQTDSSGRVRLSGRHRADFYVGDIFLGTVTTSGGRIGLEQIVGSEASASIAPVNALRLLLSLDRFRSDNRITIPVAVSRRATVADPQTAVYIDDLDFADTRAFENVAINLLPLLTPDYPFVTELVSIEAARDEF